MLSLHSLGTNDITGEAKDEVADGEDEKQEKPTDLKNFVKVCSTGTVCP